MSIDFMLDLETLDTQSNGAAIMQIGCTAFDTESLTVIETQCWTIGKEEATGTISDGTIEWWYSQPEEIRQLVWHPKNPVLPDDAIGELTEFFCRLKQGQSRIWGNSAAFDIGNLKALYDFFISTFPFSFRQEMCYRTVKNLFPHIKLNAKPDGLPHTADYDSLVQALHLIEILRHVKSISNISGAGGQIDLPLGTAELVHMPQEIPTIQNQGVLFS